MKKILLIVLAVLVAAGLVAFMVIRQQSGYTKVYTATLTREDLSTVVSGTGQIKPKELRQRRRECHGPHHPSLRGGRRQSPQGRDGRHH